MSSENTKSLVQIVKYLCMMVLVASLVSLTACSTYQAGQTDQAAAAGAVIGGGLGAVAGGQSGGGAVAGLSLGAIAGAGIGSYVGDRFERDSNSMQAQAETIRRQQREIQQKQTEINDLRRMGQDQVAFRSSGSHYGNMDTGNAISETIHEQELMAAPAPAMRDVHMQPRAVAPSYDGNVVYETTSGDMANSNARAAYDWDRKAETMTPECAEAQEESTKATGADEMAEQLYHYRRALRLCPERADFHIGISKVYLKLERYEDAKYELEEALKLDPSHNEANEMMRAL